MVFEFFKKKRPKESLLSAGQRHRVNVAKDVKNERELIEWTSKKRWGVYTLDAKRYVQDFGFLFPSAKRTPDAVKKRVERTGEPVLIIDIAGMGDARDFGAHEGDVRMINAILDRGPDIPPNSETRTIVAGDLVRSEAQRELFNAIDKTGLKIFRLFCAPGLGFTRDKENPYVEAQLAKLFLGLRERFDDEGEGYLDLWNFRLRKKLIELMDTHKIPYTYAKGRLLVSGSKTNSS